VGSWAGGSIKQILKIPAIACLRGLAGSVPSDSTLTGDTDGRRDDGKGEREEKARSTESVTGAGRSLRL